MSGKKKDWESIFRILCFPISTLFVFTQAFTQYNMASIDCYRKNFHMLFIIKLKTTWLSFPLF